MVGLAAGVGGCAESNDRATGSTVDEPTFPTETTVDGRDLLTCGGDLPSFSASALSVGIDVSLQEAEIRAALDNAGVDAGLGGPRTVQGEESPDLDPRVLASHFVDDAERLLVAVGRWDLAIEPVEGNKFYVVLDREGEGWRATGWGNCDLAPATQGADGHNESR